MTTNKRRNSKISKDNRPHSWLSENNEPAEFSRPFLVRLDIAKLNPVIDNSMSSLDLADLIPSESQHSLLPVESHAPMHMSTHGLAPLIQLLVHYTLPNKYKS